MLPLSPLVARVAGDDVQVNALTLRDTVSGATRSLAVRGLFVAIGHTPSSAVVAGLVQLDPQGYIVTSRSQATSVLGVWAAGDVQDPVYRQAITAAASGCVAALEVARYLDGIGHAGGHSGGGSESGGVAPSAGTASSADPKL